MASSLTDDGLSPWQHCPLAMHPFLPRHCGPPGSRTVCPWDGDLEGQDHLWRWDGPDLSLSGWGDTWSPSWDGIAILEYSVLEDILFGWKMRSGMGKKKLGCQSQMQQGQGHLMIYLKYFFDCRTMPSNMVIKLSKKEIEAIFFKFRIKKWFISVNKEFHHK